jgi:putative transposase
MPNHFHLLLEQVAEDGISKFFQKMLTSYTLYFNKKQRRSGVLFQGVFKSSHIKTNERLLDLSKYIHRNPIKILSTSSSRDAKNLEKRLLNYPWSSFSCFAGDKNDCVVNEGKLVILNQFKSPRDYVKYVVSET